MTRLAPRLTRGLMLSAQLLWTVTASAQEAPRTPADISPEEDGAWARDITPEHQRLALDSFQEGNTLLVEFAFPEAAAKYRQALEHWDHPAIHYNLALALMDFDQPTEIHRHLVAASLHGPAPLDEAKYKHALDYKAFLEKQLVWLDVTCDEPGATVTLDGRTLFESPNHFRGLIHPGLHSLVAVKPDRVFIDDKPRALRLEPGTSARVSLKLYPPSEVTRYRTRWPDWMPWTLMGSGLAVAAGGGLLQWQTQRSYNALDAQVTDCRGCIPSPEMMALRTRGDRMQGAAMGAYALGGAGVVAGAVLLYLNRPQAYLVNPETGQETVSITPMLGDTTGLHATLRYGGTP